MADLVELIANVPTRELAPGEVLITEGQHGGDIHVLLMGSLAVERDGVTIATLDMPGALVGEMSVLLDKPVSATVRAVGNARVRTLKNAAAAIKADAELAMRIAALVASRLDATSSVLVELSRDHAGKPHEQSLITRIFAALFSDDGLTDDEREKLYDRDRTLGLLPPV